MTKPIKEKGGIFGTPKQIHAMRSNFVPACWIVVASVLITAVVVSCSNDSPLRVEHPVVKGEAK